jgi:outer membrane lipoprotein SlyB
MEAVTSQSGSTRVRSLAIAAAVAVSVAALIGLGMFPGKRTAATDEASLPRSDLKPAPPAACALCGIVESIRSVEVYDEPNMPGGAIANDAVSMLDSLSGVLSRDVGERNVRKRLVWRVTVRMDDGSYRAISLQSPPVFAVGEKVRVVEGRLVRA